MLTLLLTLIGVVVIIGIAYWILGNIPLPTPFDWIVRVIIGVVILIFVFNLFFGGGLATLGHGLLH